MPQSTATTSQNLSAQQAKFVHPTYQVLHPIWSKLRDVREGVGGFLDGTYLIGHPREYIQRVSERVEDGKTIRETVSTNTPTKKLKARRKLASYENFAATIIDALTSALTREQPIRRVGPEPDPPPQPNPQAPPKLPTATELKSVPKQPQPRPVKKKTEKPPTPIEAWWENVDGAGTHIDDFIPVCFDIAATFGFMHLYMDTPEGTDAETAADEPMPFLRAYTPLDAPDWLVDDLGQLKAIKFMEVAPRTDLTTAWRPEVRYRVVDSDKWVLYDQKGNIVKQGNHMLGVIPVVTLFSQRRPLEPNVGAPVLGDPNLYVDLYNLISEVRELLRNQTFGILNVPLGAGEGAMTVTEAQTMMGNSTGTENVLFSGLAADFIQPDTANVTAYHEELARKLRAIYRLVGLPWESDSKDAEAEGSLKIKREDMNQRLSKFANELQQAEFALAKLFYRSKYGADQGESKFEQDDVQIVYPDSFEMTPFEEVLAQAEAAMSLGMPAVFLKELRKMLARKFTGMSDLPDVTLAAIDEAIDQAPDDLSPAEQANQRLNLTMQSMKDGGNGEPKPPMKKAAA